MTLPSDDEVANIAIAFVRGDVSWDTFRDVGVVIQMAPGKLELHFPPGIPTVEVSARDVATGFLRHWAIGTQLREWAAVLLASDFIDFADLEARPGGEVLIDALWAAAAIEPISEAAIDFARVISESPL